MPGPVDRTIALGIFGSVSDAEQFVVFFAEQSSRPLKVCIGDVPVKEKRRVTKATNRQWTMKVVFNYFCFNYF